MCEIQRAPWWQSPLNDLPQPHDAHIWEYYDGAWRRRDVVELARQDAENRIALHNRILEEEKAKALAISKKLASEG